MVKILIYLSVYLFFVAVGVLSYSFYYQKKEKELMEQGFSYGESENIVMDETGIVFDDTWPNTCHWNKYFCVRKDGVVQGSLVLDNFTGTWLWIKEKKSENTFLREEEKAR